MAFAGRVIENSLQLVGDRVPCEFTAVAIGSLARGEATSYSDLEYLFLIDKKTPETELFFEQLAMTTYFVIGNLSETKLRYMGIKDFLADEANGQYVFILCSLLGHMTCYVIVVIVHKSFLNDLLEKHFYDHPTFPPASVT